MKITKLPRPSCTTQVPGIQDSTVPVSWKGGGTNIFVHLKTDEGAEGLGFVLDPNAVKRYRVDRFVSLT